MTTTRPTFDFNGKPVRAAGLIINVVENGKVYHLMRHTHNKWSDIGGKTDGVDKDILATVVRETTEETNNSLFSPFHTYDQAYELLDNILRNEELDIFYLHKAKYLLIKVTLDTKLKQLPMKRFGLYEHHDNMKHYYKWICDVQRYHCHPRLRYDASFDKIFNTI